MVSDSSNEIKKSQEQQEVQKQESFESKFKKIEETLKTPDQADALSNLLDDTFNKALADFGKDNKDKLDSLNTVVTTALTGFAGELTEEQKQDKQTLENLQALLKPFVTEKTVENKTETYTVKSGDNLSKIAKEKGITLAQIKELNSDLFKESKDSKGKSRQLDGGLIYPGDVIKIKTGKTEQEDVTVRDDVKKVEEDVTVRDDVKKVEEDVTVRDDVKNMKSFSNIVIPDSDNNPDIKNIIKKINRLEKGLDEDNGLDEIQKKEKELNKIDEKITSKTDEVAKQDKYIRETISKNSSLSPLLEQNQQKHAALQMELTELTNQKKNIKKDISELKEKNQKENEKDLGQVNKITEQVTKLQEQLSTTKQKYIGEKELLTKQIASVKNLIVGNEVLTTLSEEDRKVITRQNNLLQPQLANLEKQLDKTNMNLAQLDTLIDTKGPITNYLAQFGQEKTNNQEPQIAQAQSDKGTEKQTTNEITNKNVLEKLSQITLDELFGEKNSEIGKNLFDYIHDNWNGLSNDAKTKFQSKVAEKYKENDYTGTQEELKGKKVIYNGEELTALNDGNEKIFETNIKLTSDDGKIIEDQQFQISFGKTEKTAA